MRPRRAWCVLPALFLVLAAGCEEPRHVGGAPKGQAKKKAEDPFIVGKTTTQIGRADDPALQKGAVRAAGKITAKDPLSIQGNAYVVAIDRIAVMNVQHALDIYHAANDRWPADHDEFMKEIIQANGIALPKLPYYQKYVYEANKHELQVWEYPELKAGPMPGQEQPQ